jgi:glycosyltransferase involved in cell wall biosynthesis
VKGFDVLLEAWPAQAHATLALLGDGPERDRLQAIVQRRGLGNVHLLGHRHDVREWLACADLMVIASRREGFPYVLVEALQAGVPVVSTAVSGASEMLAAEWLAPPDTVADLQALLERVLPRSKAELAGLQGELIARAQDELTLAGMAAAIEALYDELLGETAREKEDR